MSPGRRACAQLGVAACPCRGHVDEEHPSRRRGPPRAHVRSRDRAIDPLSAADAPARGRGAVRRGAATRPAREPCPGIEAAPHRWAMWRGSSGIVDVTGTVRFRRGRGVRARRLDGGGWEPARRGVSAEILVVERGSPANAHYMHVTTSREELASRLPGSSPAYHSADQRSSSAPEARLFVCMGGGGARGGRQSRAVHSGCDPVHARKPYARRDSTSCSRAVRTRSATRVRHRYVELVRPGPPPDEVTEAK